ncbi:MAG: DNA mismatch repair protein MutS [Myxococcota bacterium]|nr:DNA mismatch repair protein MutS [Myxococcota bacterium]
MAQVEVTTEARHGIPAGIKLTPMMKQYVAAKARYPDALLFFRMGDFYEMFFEDAELGGQYLELTVTSRDKDSPVPAPMSGFPHHQLSTYLARALDVGLKVAVCEQLEDPTMAKGIVKRGITRVITPGVVLDADSLDARTNNFLVAIVESPHKAAFGLAALDISTGEFRVTELPGDSALRCELSRLEPKELILNDASPRIESALGIRLKRYAVSRPGVEFFDDERADELLADFLGPAGTNALNEVADFGFGHLRLIRRAAGAAAGYVFDTQQKLPTHARLLSPYRVHETLILDETAKANLELFRTVLEGRKRGSLLSVLDRAATAMGGRRIRHLMAYPLMDPVAINRRLDAVAWLRENAETRAHLRVALQGMYDVERLNARVAAGTAGPRDLWFLQVTLSRIPEVLQWCAGVEALRPVADHIDALPDLLSTLSNALADDPPAVLKEGGVIRHGFNAELDEYVALSSSGRQFLVDLEARERASTGIGSLKVKFNRVFGYFIEVTRAHLQHVPEHYIRKQTLTNSERYFTEELKDFEEKVLNAEGLRSTLENELFDALRLEVGTYVTKIAATAAALADLDALAALAEVAHQHNYCRPVVDDGDVIEICDARHPVVEQAVGREDFVPNSIRLDREEQSLIILTGPNMAGKSTVMRQVALVTLMAQMGGFVPAQSATIGVVDRIFTRVGAADDLAAGRSTFMVEMHETATILSEATPRSLLILDEIGRGTSNIAGVSIAWAVAEYIHDVLGAKTLFATHYHELTELAHMKPRVANFTIAVKEWNDEVVFLRQLVEGSASRSYGIQVARLAGLPAAVVERSKKVLSTLQTRSDASTVPVELSDESSAMQTLDTMQLNLFTPPPVPSVPSAIEQAVLSCDLENMSPLQALNFLHALRARKISR